MSMLLIVPEPLFDSEIAVHAYRLCTHDGSKLFNLGHLAVIDDNFSNPGLDIVNELGIEPFAGDKKLFVDISATQLVAGVPTKINFPSESVVYILPEKLFISEEGAKYIKNLMDSGYSVAIDSCPSRQDEGMSRAKYIFLDYKDLQFSNQYYFCKRNYPNLHIVITNVPNAEVFGTLNKDTTAFFSGNFYSQPVTGDDAQLSPIKINLLQLLSKINQEEFELSEIISTIERDPYLVVSLLKFINTDEEFGLKRKIESIKQAIIILGQKSVRKWASVALSVNLAEDRPNEITRLALVRAKFAEGLAGAFELGIFSSDLFMTGLFSLLDVMLEKPMAEALEEVAVTGRIKEALVDKKGAFAAVLELIGAYECADWDRATILMIQNNVDMDKVQEAYLDSLKWYRHLLQSIDDSPSEEETEEEEPNS